uniref:Uncharacterized protein n=1 Tax=Caulerpa okamurae TaxID=118247 RepID=A0A3S5FWT0_9CHLO|nr:hypothetical protein [Caulerpa okamurae]
MSLRRETPITIVEGELLDLSFFYKFLGKTYTFNICYLIAGIEENKVQKDSLDTTSLNLGRIFEANLIENSLLRWFTEDVRFFRIRINKITYNLSPTLQGTAVSTRDSETGVYICSLICENPSRTYNLKINGFCAPRSSFKAPIISDRLVPLEEASIGIPENLVIKIKFFGITSTNKLSPVEILEGCN